MAAKRRDVDDEEQQRWEALRVESMTQHQKLLAGGPSDALGALAWKAGSVLDRRHSFDNDLRERIERARAERFTWREISAALGEGDDDDSARRVADQQKWRNKSFEQHAADADVAGTR